MELRNGESFLDNTKQVQDIVSWILLKRRDFINGFLFLEELFDG
jgi:hypothetical protein